MTRRWLWRVFLTAYVLTICACACGVTGKVPWRVAWAIANGNPAYAAVTPRFTPAAYQRSMNALWAAQKPPLRMSRIRCELHGGAEICSFELTGKAVKGGHECATALIDPVYDPGVATWDVFSDPQTGASYVHTVKCGETMPNTKLQA